MPRTSFPNHALPSSFPGPLQRTAKSELDRPLTERKETQRRHTAALADAGRRLQREISRREKAEIKIRESRAKYRTLLVQSQVMEGKLRQLTRQIILAQEHERKEISRELHDDVVQTLVGINVALAALGSGIIAGTHAIHGQVARTQRLVQHSIRAVHRFARELRPAVLDDLGLIPALHAYSQNLAARKKIRIRITASRRVEELTGDQRTALFRVAQEALNNVARHAEATQVVLVLAQRAGGVEMTISDDGKSFPVAKTLVARNNKRLGLIGMKERIEMIGGTFGIESTPEVGTTIRAIVPFAWEQRRK